MNIAKEIGLPALLGQTAEELSELTKAILKYQRILMGQNPTPVTAEKALADILEESVDVKICLSELDKAGICTADHELRKYKETRWENRIMEAKYEKDV